MSQEYYYLISSLPALSLTEQPQLTFAQFLLQSAARLSEKRSCELAAVSLVPDGDFCCGAERAWQAWETYLRNVLVRLRAGNAQINADHWLRPITDAFPTDEHFIEEIFAKADPVIRERQLDELRWQQLNHLATGHIFDFDALVIYALRLQLVEKWQRRNEEEGQTTLLSLVDSGIKQAQEIKVMSEKSIQ